MHNGSVSALGCIHKGVRLIIFTDILLSLEDLVLPIPRGLGRNKPSIPTPGGTLLVELDRLGLPRALLERKVSLGTNSQAITLALRLLNSFRPSFTCNPCMKREDFLARQSLAWILNGYQRLWKVTLSLYQNAGSAALDSTSWIVLQFLTSLEPKSEQESFPPDPLQSDIEFLQTWLQCLSEAFSLDGFSQMPALQLGLSSFLCRIIEATKGPNMLAECMSYTLLPVLIDIRKNPMFLTFDSDLQVPSANNIRRKDDGANWFFSGSSTRLARKAHAS